LSYESYSRQAGNVVESFEPKNFSGTFARPRDKMFYYLREFPARVTAEYIFWRRKRLYLRGLYDAFRFRVASETGAIQKIFLSAFSQSRSENTTVCVCV